MSEENSRIERLESQLWAERYALDATRQIAATRQKRILELEAELQDWLDTAMQAVADGCDDEAHCTCVPALRKRIAELETELGR